MDASLDPIDLLAEGTFSIRAAVDFSDLSRSQLYELMGEGKLAYVKSGRRRLIPRKALIAHLRKGLVDAGAEPRPVA